MVEQALKRRKHKPMFIVDIAVPRDVESQVSELNDVFLYTVDDLREVIDENKLSRQQAAEMARDIVDEGVRKYELDQKALSAVSTIKEFREYVSEIRDEELDKAIKNLRAGQDPEEVLSRLARGLSNKFMHEPTASLKQAGTDNNHTLIQSVKKLFSFRNS